MTNPFPLPRQTRETEVIVGDGRATYGPFAFRIWDAADATAVVSRQNGEFLPAAILAAKTTAERFAFFTVTFTPPLVLGDRAIVRSTRLHERLGDVTRGGSITGAELERELSTQGTILQELRRDETRNEFEVMRERTDRIEAIAGERSQRIEADRVERVARENTDRFLHGLIGDFYGRDTIDPVNVSSIEAAKLQKIDLAASYLRVGGRTFPGDGEGGLFVGSNNGSTDSFSTADGRKWFRATNEGPIATLEEAEVQREELAALLPLINPLRMLQAIWANLKENGTITPYMTGARGDGEADDRAAFQAAIDEAENAPYGRLFGRRIVVPTGHFRVGSSERGGQVACLHSTGAAHLVGLGRHSIINPLPSVPSFISNILVRPADAEAASGFRIADFFLGHTGTGRRQGLHGILLDTREAGANLPHPIISGMYVCQSYDGDAVSYGRAIEHINDETVNVNGGMYGAVIEDNRALGGGVLLVESGDSNTIRTSIISGRNNVDIGYRCIGVDATLCASDGGAGFLVMEDLNITAEAGSYAVRQGKDIHISRVYGEHLSADAGIPTANGRALAILDSLGNTMRGGSVSGGRLAAATGASPLVTTNIFVGNAASFEFSGGLTLYPGRVAGGRGIEFGEASFDNTVQRSVYFANSIASDDRIVDRGARNLHSARRGLPLNPAFVVFGSGTQEPVVSKSASGVIYLDGVVSAIGAANGETLTVLPPGFRPDNTRLLRITSDDGSGAPAVANIQVSPDGTVVVLAGAGATRFSLNCAFRLHAAEIMNG